VKRAQKIEGGHTHKQLCVKSINLNEQEAYSGRRKDWFSQEPPLCTALAGPSQTLRRWNNDELGEYFKLFG